MPVPNPANLWQGVHTDSQNMADIQIGRGGNRKPENLGCYISREIVLRNCDPLMCWIPTSAGMTKWEIYWHYYTGSLDIVLTLLGYHP